MASLDPPHNTSRINLQGAIPERYMCCGGEMKLCWPSPGRQSANVPPLEYAVRTQYLYLGNTYYFYDTFELATFQLGNEWRG